MSTKNKGAIKETENEIRSRNMCAQAKSGAESMAEGILREAG